MSREIKISIAILLIGFGAILIYWFSDNSTPKIEEEIILPSSKNYYKLPIIREYLRDIRETPIVKLQDRELDKNGKIAQNIVLKDREFLRDTKNSRGEKEHNDIMSIRPAIISRMDREVARICRKRVCYEATKYNFVTNTTTRATIDIDKKSILDIKRFANMQPDISLRLTHIAQAIALHAPEVREKLLLKPKQKDMSMANVRGSIGGSICENSNHLCVAPTFSYHKQERALWAIIDLTELRLVVAKWAGLGKTSTPSCISERVLQNRYIMENFCQKNSHHKSMGWEFDYRITGSDGLEIVDASFNGKKVLKSAKIVDWHVAYRGLGNVNTSSESIVAGRRVEYVRGEDSSFLFGYNDAMGCPMFSTSVVLSFNAPKIREIIRDNKRIGFYITQDFRNPKWPMACNYRYENRFEFYNDGSFRVVGINKGRGCGDNAIYRPIMRIDMALSDNEEFYKYSGDWQKWSIEGEDFQAKATKYYQDKYLYKITSKGRGYYIEPNRGQFNDNSRGDNAKLFATLYKNNEGAEDLLTLGSCCKLNEDGVEQFMDKRESIDGKNIVIWYVPRVKNSSEKGKEYCWADTRLGEDGNLKVEVWPCIVGAKFVPIKRMQ